MNCSIVDRIGWTIVVLLQGRWKNSFVPLHWLVQLVTRITLLTNCLDNWHANNIFPKVIYNSHNTLYTTTALYLLLCAQRYYFFYDTTDYYSPTSLHRYSLYTVYSTVDRFYLAFNSHGLQSDSLDRTIFQNKVIYFNNALIFWSIRSPDLKPCNFY